MVSDGELFYGLFERRNLTKEGLERVMLQIKEVKTPQEIEQLFELLSVI